MSGSSMWAKSHSVAASALLFLTAINAFRQCSWKTKTETDVEKGPRQS
jgi:hypothetical protein